MIGDLFLSIPDAITVTAVSPGSLIISRGGGVIGRFLSGNFQKATPTPFVSRAMGQYIKDIIKDHKGFKQFQNRYWHIYRDTLLCLLSDASTRGHGGTIVLIPSGKVKEHESFIDTKYIFKENFNFVGACPGSIAFVISQDGPVRGLIRKDEETVLCWPDCFISMFLGDIL